MTGAVIKSGEVAGPLHIRGLAVPPQVSPPGPEMRRIADLEAQLGEARREAETLRQDLAAKASAVLEARREARTEGLADGRKEAEDRSAELVRVLKEAATRAGADFVAAMDRLDRLSGDLASLALGRIVGDAGVRPELVAGALRSAAADLFQGAIVLAEVSRVDFPDVTSLEALDLPGTTPAIEVRAVEDLASGGCRLRLKLGEVDLGLDGQVARLRALLETAAPE